MKREIKTSSNTSMTFDDEKTKTFESVDAWKMEMKDALMKGTPLPKGHGRLIDADIIKDFKNVIKNYGKDYRFTQEEILNILGRYEIKYAPTIIEADKAESEE